MNLTFKQFLTEELNLNQEVVQATVTAKAIEYPVPSDLVFKKNDDSLVFIGLKDSVEKHIKKYTARKYEVKVQPAADYELKIETVKGSVGSHVNRGGKLISADLFKSLRKYDPMAALKLERNKDKFAFVSSTVNRKVVGVNLAFIALKSLTVDEILKSIFPTEPTWHKWNTIKGHDNVDYDFKSDENYQAITKLLGEPKISDSKILWPLNPTADYVVFFNGYVRRMPPPWVDVDHNSSYRTRVIHKGEGADYQEKLKLSFTIALSWLKKHTGEIVKGPEYIKGIDKYIEKQIDYYLSFAEGRAVALSKFERFIEKTRSVAPEIADERGRYIRNIFNELIKDKNKALKLILTVVKNQRLTGASTLINALRGHGATWPELDQIEKSINAFKSDQPANRRGL